MARLSFAAAAITALLVTALLGYPVIPWLQKLKFGQPIKEIGPTWHKNKEGTPTMGGLMFIVGSLLGLVAGMAVLLVYTPELAGKEYMPANINIVIGVLAALGYGAIGFTDDYIKVIKKRNLGLSAWYKIIMQLLVTAAFLGALYLNNSLSTEMVLPFIGLVDFGVYYYILTVLFIIGMVNGVNLTDGIDGLNTSVTFVVCVGIMLLAGLTGAYNVSIYAAAVAGGCAGFLVWNFHPAKVIMGDTGAMYLGGALVAMAYAMGYPQLLLFAGAVYVIEAASVIIQRYYFKFTHGKRIFKMSPIHHHFEMSGWSEIKIVTVFSGVSVAAVAAAFAYLLAIT